MKVSEFPTIGLVIAVGFLHPALLAGQTHAPQSVGSPRACEAPAASFRRVLARADSIFAGVGSQAAILRDCELAVTVENGWSDLEHRVPVTAETRFQVASVTKAFTLNSRGKWPADQATAPNVMRELVNLCLEGLDGS